MLGVADGKDRPVGLRSRLEAESFYRVVASRRHFHWATIGSGTRSMSFSALANRRDWSEPDLVVRSGHRLQSGLHVPKEFPRPVQSSAVAKADDCPAWLVNPQSSPLRQASGTRIRCFGSEHSTRDSSIIDSKSITCVIFCISHFSHSGSHTSLPADIICAVNSRSVQLRIRRYVAGIGMNTVRMSYFIYKAQHTEQRSLRDDRET